MKLLKKIPFFLFLLVLFFCLHGWLENYGFISISEVLFTGLFIFFGILLLTAMLFLFTKNFLHASLVTFFIGLWYLFFGALHDWIKSISFLSFFKRYPVIVITLLLFTLAWVIFLKFRKNLHSKLALYINLLLLIYCFLDVFLLIKIQFAKPEERVADVVKFDTAKVIKKPDIYFLLFDGYPGTTSLKDSFDFSNDSLQNYFTAHSFKALPVFANYDLTYFSMSSMFNLQYVKDDFDNLHLTQRDFQKRGVEINHAAIFPVFKSMGYAISNFSIFEIDNKTSFSKENSFLLAHSILLTDKILHNRLQRDIGDRLGRIIPFWKSSDFYQHDIDNKFAENELLRTAAQKKSSPQFVYAHFMMPHGPYYFDSLGNKNPFEKISHYSMWDDKALFISYLKYINKRMLSMVDTIINQNPGAIIIVMGDHGFRSFKSKQLYQPFRYDNLCMVRFPDNKHAAMKSKWSNVNLFRYIFNCGFAQGMPYLADSSVVLNY